MVAGGRPRATARLITGSVCLPGHGCTGAARRAGRIADSRGSDVLEQPVFRELSTARAKASSACERLAKASSRFTGSVLSPRFSSDSITEEMLRSCVERAGW